MTTERARLARVGFGCAAAVALVVVAGCSGGGSRGNASPKSGASYSQAATHAAAAAGPAAPGAQAAGGVGQAGSATASSAPLAAAKIQTATLTVSVRRAAEVTARADAADRIATSVGGQIDGDDRVSGRYARAELHLRVPPARLPAVLDQLARLGTELSRTSSATDVTERVADVSSRVASAQAAIASLRTLYARATKITDVLAVESDLQQREADLEALQAQQRALSRQTAMAAISLTLRTATPPPVAKHYDRGFTGALHRGWDGFTSAAAWVGRAVLTAVPFLALLVALCLAGWRLRRYRGMRGRRPPLVTPSAAPPPD